MHIVKSNFEILNPEALKNLAPLRRIERVGRVCYKSEDAITEDGESAKKFCRMLIKNHHEAMLEHGGDISVLFTVDRGVTHEFVRHRLASFAQESTRYCNYSKGKFGGEITVVDISTGLKLDGFTANNENFEEAMTTWENAMKDAQAYYMKLLSLGVSPQMARSVLPQSTKAEITITANIREWRHILSLRAAGTTGKPHPQMLEVMYPLLDELNKRVPILFEDILDSAPVFY